MSPSGNIALGQMIWAICLALSIASYPTEALSIFGVKSKRDFT
jgi:hypothetical protein